MIVEVPFAYAVEVVPKGKRKPIDMRLMSSVTVDIAVLTAEETPVALRWHRPGDAGSDDANPPIDYRRVGEDALFVPVFDTHAREPDRQIGLDEMIGNAGDGRDHRANPLFAGEDYSYHKANGVAADFPGATFSNSREDEVAAEIRAKAADLMSVDGLLFRRARDAEPVYELHPFGWNDRVTGEHRRSCYVKTKRIGSIPEAERDVRRHFRVDQLSEVLGAAEAEGANIPGWDTEADIAEEVATFRLAPLPEPARAPAGGPRP